MTIYSFDDVLRARCSMHTLELFAGRRIPLPRPIPYVTIIYFIAVVVAMMIVNRIVPAVDLLNSVLSVPAGADVHIASWLCVFTMIPGAIVWAATNSAV